MQGAQVVAAKTPMASPVSRHRRAASARAGQASGCSYRPFAIFRRKTSFARELCQDLGVAFMARGMAVSEMATDLVVIR